MLDAFCLLISMADSSSHYCMEAFSVPIILKDLTSCAKKWVEFDVKGWEHDVMSFLSWAWKEDTGVGQWVLSGVGSIDQDGKKIFFVGL